MAKTNLFSIRPGEVCLWQEEEEYATEMNPEEACELAEALLRWAAEQDPQPHGRRDWASLESRIASHLWNKSALRHGLFTPPEFSCLVEMGIREFFQAQPIDAQALVPPPQSPTKGP